MVIWAQRHGIVVRSLLAHPALGAAALGVQVVNINRSVAADATPHFGKARRIATEITRAGAGVPLPDGAALTAALRRVLTDDAEHARLVEAGRALLAAHRGAAERQADAISELLG